MPKSHDRLKRAEHLRSRASPRVSKKRRFGRQTRPASRASLGPQGQQGSSEAPGSSRTRGPPSLAQSTQNGRRCFARFRTRRLLLVLIRVLGPGRKPDKEPARRTSWTTPSAKFELAKLHERGANRCRWVVVDVRHMVARILSVAVRSRHPYRLLGVLLAHRQSPSRRVERRHPLAAEHGIANAQPARENLRGRG